MFKIGDRVKYETAHKYYSAIPDLQNGVGTVKSVPDDQSVYYYVEAVTKPGLIYPYVESELALVEEQKGTSIAFEDVRVGDLIRAQWPDHYREGVVAAIKDINGTSTISTDAYFLAYDTHNITLLERPEPEPLAEPTELGTVVKGVAPDGATRYFALLRNKELDSVAFPWATVSSGKSFAVYAWYEIKDPKIVGTIADVDILAYPKED